jgi:hypothetical protein
LDSRIRPHKRATCCAARNCRSAGRGSLFCAASLWRRGGCYGWAISYGRGGAGRIAPRRFPHGLRTWATFWRPVGLGPCRSADVRGKCGNSRERLTIGPQLTKLRHTLRDEWGSSYSRSGQGCPRHEHSHAVCHAVAPWRGMTDHKKRWSVPPGQNSRPTRRRRPWLDAVRRCSRSRARNG